MKRVPVKMILMVLALACAAVAQQPKSATGLLRAFFEAVNSNEPGAVAEFYKDGVTERFRTLRSPEENRAFYERIRNDLGKLTVQGMRRVGPAKAVATLEAEKMSMPVEFAFDLVDGKIDGLSVHVGGHGGGGRETKVRLPEGASDEELAVALDRQLRELVKADEFSGVVLLARNGEPIFHRGYGFAERESGRLVTTGTRFDVASITKFLTKIAVAQLAQTGTLELSDLIFEHLPKYPNPEAARKITIQHLVDHSSGLGDIFNQRWMEVDKSVFIEPVDFFSIFADQPLRFEPGERRFYSNAGYITLGAVVAAVSGTPYFEYIEENILRPAGMTASGFPAKDGSDPGIAVGYTRGGPMGGHTDAGGPLRANLGMLPMRGCPASSSTHSAEDLLELDRALRAGKLLNPKWTAWVFGSEVVDEDGGYKIGVAGGGPGVSAGWQSDGAVTAIVLANLDPPAGEGLAMELYRALAAP